MFIQFSTLIILFLSSILLSSCSPQSFQSDSISSSSNSNGSNTSQGTNPPVTPVPDSLAQVDLKGSVESSQSTFNNVLTFDFDKKNGEFIIMIPMPNGVLFSPSGVFSKYPDIKFSPLLDNEGRLKFSVRIPIKYIIKGVAFSEPTHLPNGDSLPMMPQGYGELPSLSINFPLQNNTQVHLYIGVNAIGLFITLPPNVNLPIGFTLPIKNKNKSKTFGYLTYVPSKVNYAPGLFISTIIPPEISKILEDYFKL